MNVIKHGFGPVYDSDSRVLILGSFPSVKSREIQFYYGNPQNRFWRVICGYFGKDIPLDTQGKIGFLHENHIALWDIVTECEIEGSKDDTIKNYKVADLGEILDIAKIELIILNGTTAFSVFRGTYGNLGTPFVRLPSTSPANTRFDENLWVDALDRVFK